MRYFDHAATSFPKDPRVIEAVVHALQEVGVAPDRGASVATRRASALVWETRRLAALALAVDCPERITFTLNGTDALNLALKGLLQPGDEVVTTAVEHNSVMRPLIGLRERQSLRVAIVPADERGVVKAESILEKVTDRTRLVVMSHASNVTGALQPVQVVGRGLRDRGTALVVDAAQSAGYRDLAEIAEVADLIAVPGHKGLGGPLGTGLLWVRPGLDLVPLREGGTGTRSEQTLQPQDDPGSLEAGSPNLPGIAGLGEALRIRIHEQGLAEVQAARFRAGMRFLEAASSLAGCTVHGPGADQRELVFPVTLEGWTPAEAAVALETEFGIRVRSGLHCAPGAHEALGTAPRGTLRFSFGAFPSEEEIDFAVESLKMLRS